MRTTFTVNLRTAAGAAVLAAVTGVSAVACTHSPSVQQQEQAAQQADTQSLENSQPIPHYNYSQIRQTAIDAETIAADGAQTTSFFFQMGARDPVYSCPSLGIPVPVTAQLSNPEQVVGVSGSIGGGHDTLPQMDPDGIYAPPSSSGTYVICVGSGGQKYLMYWEGDVLTATSAATWNDQTHQIQVTGAPTAVIHTGSGK
jgi:hypothetical protein